MQKKTESSRIAIDSKLIDELMALPENRGVSVLRNVVERSLKNYIEMQKSQFYYNSKMTDDIVNTLSAKIELTNRAMSNRFAKLLSENAININVLSQLMNHLLSPTSDIFENKNLLNEFRLNAVEDLKSGENIYQERMIYDKERYK